MAILHKNITVSSDIHNPKWLPDANNGDYAFKNEKGELESIDELLLPAALNFVDGSVAPPTTTTGDIYILSSGGSVNAGWGSVALQDWVRYDGTAWNSLTPQKSSLCYDKTADSLMAFDGSAWAAIGGGGGGNTIYTADDSLTGARTVTHNNNNLNFETGSSLFLVDDTATIGKITIGAHDRAIFAHKDYATTTQYALHHSATGYTLLNTITSKEIQFTKEHNTVYGKMTDTGKWILGGGSFLTTEKILLDGNTVIKGGDTLVTSSALRIYDGDTTPSVLWAFRNNGDIVQGKDSTIDTNGNTLTIDGDTVLNANVNMPNLPTSSAGLSSGDIYNDSGTLKIV